MSYPQAIIAKVGDDEGTFGWRNGDDHVVLFAHVTDGPKNSIGRRVEVRIDHSDLLRLAWKLKEFE